MARLTGKPASITANSAPITVTLSPEEFVSGFNITDEYWANSANWDEVQFYYRDALSGQTEIFIFKNNTAQYSLASNARNGSWQCMKIAILDSLDDFIVYTRSQFPIQTEFDFTVGGGVPIAGTPTTPYVEQSGVPVHISGTAANVRGVVATANGGTGTSVLGNPGQIMAVNNTRSGFDFVEPPQVQSVNGFKGSVVIDKSHIGLGNVDNTSDTAKPISAAQQVALDSKVDKVQGMTLVDPIALQTNLNAKVDKVEGLQLSQESYTTEEKTKLAGVVNTGTLLRITNFSANGTWTKQADVGRILVKVVGGGGNGGNGNSPAGGSGGGGGAGGYAEEFLLAANVTATVAVTVGAAGGTSSFGGYCSATGGANGGAAGLGGGLGGLGSGGTLNLRGGGGSGGGAPGGGGAGGSSMLGGGAPGSGSGNGAAATANSGGGGGGAYNGTGGAGASGRVVVYEYA